MKKNNLLVTIILTITMLVQLRGYAQTWSFYKNYPVNINPWMADSDNMGNLYMLTSNREIWKKNNSDSWNKFPDFPVSNFFEITVNKNNGVIYAADEFQGLVFTGNNGVLWQQAFLETNSLSGFHESVTTLSNINNSNILYGGGISAIFPFAPVIFKYTINGSSVSNIQKIEFNSEVNYDNIPNAVCQTSDGSKILIGTVNNGIWISINGGSNFENVLSGNQVYKIVNGPDNSFYALIRNNGSNQNQLLKSTDGITWSPLYTNTDPNDNLTTLYFDESSAELWLGTEKTIYKISDLNSATPALESQNFNNTEQRVVTILKSNGVIHQFSSEFIAQKKVDNTWVSDILGLIGSSSQILFGPDNTVYSLDYTSSVISTSTDSGTDWQNFYIPGNIQAGLQNLSKDENGNIYFTKINKLFRINSSNDLQEINVPNPNSIFISKLFVSSNGNIYLTHNDETNKLYRSPDGGQTWLVLFETPNFFDSYNSLCDNGQGLIFFTLDFNEAELYYSLDNGQNWNVFNYDFNLDPECGNNTMSSIYTSGNLIFFSVCFKSFLLEFNDNNIDLTEISFPNASAPGLILSNENGFYTVLDDGTVYKSVNNGETWQSVNKPVELAPFPNSVYPLLLTNSNNEVFVQTTPSFGLPENVRGIYKLTEVLNLPEHNNLEAVIYPNPTTDIIHIQCAEVITEYQLYDILGKNIDGLKPVTNNRLDISHLTTGIYLLKLKTAEGKQDTFKIVKD